MKQKKQKKQRQNNIYKTEADSTQQESASVFIYSSELHSDLK